MPRRPDPVPRQRTYQARIFDHEGDVYLTLPDNQYVKMTPLHTRSMAWRMLRAANTAEGKTPSGNEPKTED